MTKRDIAKELIQGLEEAKAWKRGEAKLRSFTVELPKAADVALIRKELGYSQEEFASAMGVSVATLRNWEQARREPHGPARALLLVASRNPKAVRDVMQALVKPRKAAKRLPVKKEAKEARLAKLA
jgi:putative transcriptional regulator